MRLLYLFLGASMANTFWPKGAAFERAAHALKEAREAVTRRKETVADIAVTLRRRHLALEALRRKRTKRNAAEIAGMKDCVATSTMELDAFIERLLSAERAYDDACHVENLAVFRELAHCRLNPHPGARP